MRNDKQENEEIIKGIWNIRILLIITTGSESGIGSSPATSYTSQDLEIESDKCLSISWATIFRGCVS